MTAAAQALRVITPAENAGFRELDEGMHEVIRGQIGAMNVLAISGGRWARRATGITLPVSSGYSVHVDLDGNDTYVVRRVFTRAGVSWIKGEARGIYCEVLGEVAYQASCYVNVAFGE